MIASASAGQDRTTKLWDPGLQPLKTFPEFSEPALRVTFTHDGKRVVAGDWAGQVRMWNIEEAQQVAQLPPNPPTLVMQIAEHQQQLTAARTESEQAAVELKAAQEQEATAELALPKQAAAEAAQAKVAGLEAMIQQLEAEVQSRGRTAPVKPL